MTMVYVSDKNGRTFALPSHIIRDFEISNVRLEAGTTGRGSPTAAIPSRLQSLWDAIELDLTVGELRSILGLGDVTRPELPTGLCAGLPSIGRGSTSGRGPLVGLAAGLCAGLPSSEMPSRGGQGSIDALPSGLCAGLPEVCPGDGPWVSFFSDSRLQNVRLRLKASQLSACLYGTR